MEINIDNGFKVIIKKLIEESLENDKLNIKEMEKKMTNKIDSLHKNTEFFKAILATAMTLDETIKFAESNNRRIPLFSLTDIITGAVIELEKSGFVKIIREEDEE